MEEFVYFSFMQGVVAFFAPCAVALLPGYVIAFISRSEETQPTLSTKTIRGLKLSFLSIAGILLIYTLAGAMIILAAQVLKDYMKWITIAMGSVLILLGLLMMVGKSFSFSINMNSTNKRSETVEAFVFGMAYAIGALGCLFPLFLVVATQAMAASSAFQGATYIGAYFGGISIMMIITILLSTFARDFLMKYLRKILPYMERFTGALLILAGIYIIYYQMVLI
ncbi:MAG: cytochrome c biogenesis CcdA family protein [Balneolaceae bacterium]